MSMSKIQRWVVVGGRKGKKRKMNKRRWKSEREGVKIKSKRREMKT